MATEHGGRVIVLSELEFTLNLSAKQTISMLANHTLVPVAGHLLHGGCNMNFQTPYGLEQRGRDHVLTKPIFSKQAYISILAGTRLHKPGFTSDPPPVRATHHMRSGQPDVLLMVFGSERNSRILL